jgi:two-component system, LytTR family, sensor histidine kinase AgrC
MNIKKIVVTLLTINVLQFVIGLVIWVSLGFTVISKGNIYIYLSIGLLLFSSLITIFGLYFATRLKNDNLEDSIKNLEEFNTILRSQRHDYLNHFQVIYGLMELNEYEEAKKYIEPVFKDIMKVSKALKTAQPAINALLQAKIELAEKNNIDMFLEIRSELKYISIEPWNLCKVLANIIDNSITALQGSLKDKIINLEISEDKSYYSFIIWNNGPKIPENLINEIFKQGYTTKNLEGHGMGLYIVSKIVQEAGGKINVVSSYEKTSFMIELPIKN